MHPEFPTHLQSAAVLCAPLKLPEVHRAVRPAVDAQPGPQASCPLALCVRLESHCRGTEPVITRAQPPNRPPPQEPDLLDKDGPKPVGVPAGCRCPPLIFHILH